MAKEKIYGIYCIENTLNGHKYVGQSENLGKRINQRHHGSHALLGAMEKYGKENFKSYIVKYCKMEEIDELEIFYIKELRSHVSEGGYNISWGGSAPMRGRKHSQETLDRLSEVQRGENHWNFGKHWGEDVLEKMRETKKNITDEMKENMSNAQIRHYEENGSPTLGIKHKNSSSVYVGVSWFKIYSKWRSGFQCDNKKHFVGYFINEIDAAVAYDKYVIVNKLDRPLNFPNSNHPE